MSCGPPPGLQAAVVSPCELRAEGASGLHELRRSEAAGCIWAAGCISGCISSLGRRDDETEEAGERGGGALSPLARGETWPPVRVGVRVRATARARIKVRAGQVLRPLTLTLALALTRSPGRRRPWGLGRRRIASVGRDAAGGRLVRG